MEEEIKLERKLFKSEKRRFFDSVQPEDPAVTAIYTVEMSCTGPCIYQKRLFFRDGQSAHRYMEQLMKSYEQGHPQASIIKESILDPENSWQFKAKRSYFDDAEHTAYTTFKMERLQVFGKAV